MGSYPSLLRLGGWRCLKLLIPLAALRLSAFIWGVTNVDETTFYVIARSMRAGALPYVDVADIKPLLAYVAFAPAGFMGWRMWPMQLLAAGWILVTALLLGRVVMRWSGDREAGWTATWLALLATCCAVPAISVELLFNLPVAAALLGAVHTVKGRLRWVLAAGLCAGAASLFKHQAAITLLAMAAGIPWTRWFALAAGFCATWTFIGGAYAALGHWQEFVDWNITRNFSYTAHDPTSPLFLLAEGLGAGVLLAAPVAWVFAVRAAPGAWRDPFGRVAVAELVLTAVAVSIGGRFYLHYFIQFVPALAVLAAPGLTALLRRWPELRASAHAALATGIAIPIAAWMIIGPVRGVMGTFPDQDPKAIEIARWVQAHSVPSERLFVWGAYSPLYFLSHRLPGTRFVDASPLAGNFDPGHVPDGFDVKPYQSERDVNLAIDDLERNRPAWVIDTAPADLHDWRHFPLSDFPALAAYVAAHYEVAGKPAGAIVYRRRG